LFAHGSSVSRDRRFYLKATLLLYAAWLVIFEIVGRYAATLPTYDLTMAIDRRIPLVPGFVWAYEACYVFPFAPLFLLEDWHRFNRGVLAALLANVLAFAVYLALPIAYAMPSLGHTVAEQVLAMEYAIDFHPGANKLPSMHVAFAWITGLTCRGRLGKGRRGKALDAGLFGCALLISIAATFVKQHLLIDVVAGVVWAFAAWGAAGWLYPRLGGGETEARDGLRRMLRRAAPWAIAATAGMVALRAALPP
jgi:membrane-associated phospholipid phosphatase